MVIWIDAQLSPALAEWLNANFAVTAKPLRELGLRDAADEEIFQAARAQEAVVLTKDSDFILLLERFGPPPKIIWLTCGNTSNQRLKEILAHTFAQTMAWLVAGEQLVEINAKS